MAYDPQGMPNSEPSHVDVIADRPSAMTSYKGTETFTKAAHYIRLRQPPCFRKCSDLWCVPVLHNQRLTHPANFVKWVTVSPNLRNNNCSMFHWRCRINNLTQSVFSKKVGIRIGIGSGRSVAFILSHKPYGMIIGSE